MLLVFFGQFSHYAPYLSLRVTHTPKYIIVLRFGHMLAKCRWFYSHKRTSERKNMKHVIYDKQKYKFQHPKNEWLLGSCCYTLAFWCKEMAANMFATKDAWSPKKNQTRAAHRSRKKAMKCEVLPWKMAKTVTFNHSKVCRPLLHIIIHFPLFNRSASFYQQCLHYRIPCTNTTEHTTSPKNILHTPRK